MAENMNRPLAVQDLMDDVEKAEIFVMRFNYDGFAGWLNSENTKNVKYIFGE